MPFKFIVRFEDRDESDIRTDLMLSSTNLAVFKLLPYQQQAFSYLDCTVYYDSDFSSIYYQIRRIVDDKIVYVTDFFEINKSVFDDLAARAGRRINTV